ncbi:hypothetical protein AOQ84DRAFT_79636 [Glonium stellatum]|uniref:DUF7791 domain-containing protein n=1 Tax=Glonium stellatum TaxID=574774 RepID=A0A8E2FB03_9PEZI|nr:hypothetical protein AOQ84DRAFT_79636 [Glonium stellatum]
MIAKGHDEIEDLFKRAAALPNIKLCLSSRPLSVFRDAFEVHPRIRLEELTAQNISIHVNDRLGNNDQYFRLTRDQPHLRSILMEDIINKASDVFLWVRLVVDILLRGLQARHRIQDLQEKLKSIPSELGGRYGLYMRMLKDIPRQNRQQGYRLFQAVLGARGKIGLLFLSFVKEEDTELPLRIPINSLSDEEIQSRIQAMEGRVMSRCAGLLEVVTKPSRDYASKYGYQALGEAKFLHQTVKGFTTHPENWEILLQAGLRPALNVNIYLMSACLSQLKALGTPRQKWDFECVFMLSEDLIHYAAQVESTTGHSHTKLLDHLDQTVWELWRQYEPANENSKPGNRDVGLREHGCHWAMQELEIDQIKYGAWRTDFMAFAVEGNLILYLKDKFDYAGYRLKYKRGRPLLSYAVVPYKFLADIQYLAGTNRQADSCVTELLLSHGANPNKADNGDQVQHVRDGTGIWERSLFWAFE